VQTFSKNKRVSCLILLGLEKNLVPMVADDALGRKLQDAAFFLNLQVYNL
jgi:hypothetical protein